MVRPEGDCPLLPGRGRAGDSGVAREAHNLPRPQARKHARLRERLPEADRLWTSQASSSWEDLHRLWYLRLLGTRDPEAVWSQSGSGLVGTGGVGLHHDERALAL